MTVDQEIHEKHARALLGSGVIGQRNLTAIKVLRVVPDAVLRNEAMAGYDKEQLRAALLRITEQE